MNQSAESQDSDPDQRTTPQTAALGGLPLQLVNGRLVEATHAMRSRSTPLWAGERASLSTASPTKTTADPNPSSKRGTRLLDEPVNTPLTFRRTIEDERRESDGGVGNRMVSGEVFALYTREHSPRTSNTVTHAQLNMSNTITPANTTAGTVTVNTATLPLTETGAKGVTETQTADDAGTVLLPTLLGARAPTNEVIRHLAFGKTKMLDLVFIISMIVPLVYYHFVTLSHAIRVLGCLQTVLSRILLVRLLGNRTRFVKQALTSLSARITLLNSIQWLPLTLRKSLPCVKMFLIPLRLSPAIFTKHLVLFALVLLRLTICTINRLLIARRTSPPNIAHTFHSNQYFPMQPPTNSGQPGGVPPPLAYYNQMPTVSAPPVYTVPSQPSNSPASSQTVDENKLPNTSHVPLLTGKHD
ncbi:hypothetical protein D9615_006684 [Tricholomella constricta]|uniref:Transmembrane protein n=1 Tax=Tricholomella constricta TaxID=117010 RepID=A0A8H5M1J2_9AGAR|nr:hypothetical protein D9615_006684 [Tricholomella constricta]